MDTHINASAFLQRMRRSAVNALGAAAIACCLAVPASAGTEAEVAGFAAVSRGIGFTDKGLGVYASLWTRGSRMGANIEASAASEPKIYWNTGYSYSVLASARAYFGKVFLGGGVAHSGYSASLSEGESLKKSKTTPVLETGFDSRMVDIAVRYRPEEKQTKNDTWSLEGKLEFAPQGSGVVIHVDWLSLSYLQAGKRTMGSRIAIGVGYKW